MEKTKVKDNVEMMENVEEKKSFRSTLPEHQMRMVQLLKNNAGIRKFTAQNLIEALKEKGDVSENAEQVLIRFAWDRFIVNEDNLKREYRYNSQMFINALANAFEPLAKMAQNVINRYIENENVQ